jgi:DNA primase
MARIPDADIERLKQEVSLERLVQAQGIELKRHGADLLGLCPFHDDHEPSLVISPKKNLWHCLGACQKGGSVIDWVMRTRGVSFRHAVELLRNEHPSLAEPVRIVSKGTAGAVKLETPFEVNAGDQRVLRQVVDYYHETLKQSPEAMKYLQGRGLTHPKMIGQFRIGFSNRTLGYRLPDKNRKAGAEMRSRLQQLGIIRESGHEHFNGSVVIPVFDLDGNITEMYGRKITPGLREGTPLHLYLPGPHKGLWNELALQVSKEIILCESLIDALTFWCAGFRNVTASYGVGGFTDDHRAAFRKHSVQRVWIAYDRDEAGEKAALSLAEELMAMGIECFRILFPHKMDANECARKVQPATKLLEMFINKAQWLGKGKPPERLTVEVIPAPVPIEEPPSEEEPEEIPIPEAPAAESSEPPFPPEPQPIATEEPAAKEKTGEPVFSLAADPQPPPAAEIPAPGVQPVPAHQSPNLADIPTEVKGEEVAITLGDRRYRVRGLSKNLSYAIMRVNLLAGRGDGFHVDTLDLYAARQRAVFIKQAAVEMGLKEDVVKHDLRHVLRKLEELQDQQIQKTLEPKRPEITIGDEDRAPAMELLKDPRLLDRILADFERCGVVGEETNKQVGYIAAISRSLKTPLAVMVQSSSAAGKSSLMESILAFVPPEHCVEYSAMTGQSLFYMGEKDLKHKVLAIVEEEGASRAAYALKLLQSEGALTIASTGKEPATGRLVTHQYRVEGPVMIFLTTTAIDLDEELLNRCMVLTVNEGREQTQAIHRLQREAHTLEGLLAQHEREDILKVHQNAQRLLKPRSVVNPYARDLTFPDSLTRTRRDHTKYLTLIDAIALLHQFQRPDKSAPDHRGRNVSYIEVAKDDIRVANRLACEVLGRSLDELPPQTRRLLMLVDEAVRRECERLKMERTDFRFSRRDVRAWAPWGDTVLKKHLGRLEDLEYLLVHRGGRGQSFVYELLFDGQGMDGKPWLPGLIDVDRLECDEKKSPSEDEKARPSRPQIAGVSPGGRPHETRVNRGANGIFPQKRENSTDTGQAEKSNGIVGEEGAA